jgi:hypothetical protein
MITMHLNPGVLSKAGAASGAAQADDATATWHGAQFSARSANSAACALARTTLSAGRFVRWHARPDIVSAGENG